MCEFIIIFVQSSRYMATQGKYKQERKVVHLQMGDQHEYIIPLSPTFWLYTHNEIGFSIYQVRNNLRKLGIMKSTTCTIRVGVLQTKVKNEV